MNVGPTEIYLGYQSILCTNDTCGVSGMVKIQSVS
jgi:hypothetical protein